MTAIRLAYNTNGFAHHSLDQCLDVIAGLGYAGVSLTLDVHHLHPYEVTLRELADLRRRLETLELAVTIETGARFLLDPMRKHAPGLLARVGFERRVRFLERSIEIAAELGASVVTFASGVAEPDTDEGEQWRILVERCRALAELAGRSGVHASFEPEPGFVVETMEQYRRLRDAVAHDSFGLTLDIGHAHLLEDATIADCIVAHAADLRHVHVEDMRRPEHEHLAIGEGEIQFAPVFESLRQIGFAGLAAVELSRDSHRAPEAAMRAIELLGRHAG